MLIWDWNKYQVDIIPRWWFQICLEFSSLFGEMIQFDEYFSKGLKPPTSIIQMIGAYLCPVKHCRQTGLSFLFARAERKPYV